MTEASHGGTAVRSLRSQRRGGLGGSFRGLAWDKLPLPVVPLVQTLWAPLSLGAKSKDAHLSGKKGLGVIRGVFLALVCGWELETAQSASASTFSQPFSPANV